MLFIRLLLPLVYIIFFSPIGLLAETAETRFTNSIRLNNLSKVIRSQTPDKIRAAIYSASEPATTEMLSWLLFESLDPEVPLDNLHELISLGADLKRHFYNFSMLEKAAYCDLPQVIELFAEHNADFAQEVRSGRSLHLAISRFAVPAAEALLKLHADPNIPAEDSTLKRPLHVATMICSPEMVELLLNHSANPFLLDGNGASPLYYAIECNPFDLADHIIHQLLKAGVSIDQPTATGVTLLMMSVADQKRVEYLLTLGADPRIEDQRNMNSIAYAWQVLYSYYKETRPQAVIEYQRAIIEILIYAARMHNLYL